MMPLVNPSMVISNRWSGNASRSNNVPSFKTKHYQVKNDPSLRHGKKDTYSIKNNCTVVKSNERMFNVFYFYFLPKKPLLGRFSPKIYDFFSAVGILRWGGNTSQKCDLILFQILTSRIIFVCIEASGVWLAAAAATVVIILTRLHIDEIWT